MRKWSGFLAGAACCALLLGSLQTAAAETEEDYYYKPNRNDPAFMKLVDEEYRGLKAKGIPRGMTRRHYIKEISKDAAGLESKGFDDPKDEARDLALIRYAADLGDADAHKVLIVQARTKVIPCRQQSPSGC